MTAVIVVVTVVVVVGTCLAIGDPIVAEFEILLAEQQDSGNNAGSSPHSSDDQQVEEANLKIFTGEYSYP